jgi:3-hydroxybutyryl-CoA dehydrogenase
LIFVRIFLLFLKNKNQWLSIFIRRQKPILSRLKISNYPLFMEKIGILGTGAMGTDIAQVAARAGHEVIIFDANSHAMGRAIKRIQQNLANLVAKSKISDAESYALFSRISLGESAASFSECALIIECIVEDLETKQLVFKTLEATTSEKTILASNTSSIPITAIAAHLKHPERVIGIHFFNPATIMKLVEIIPALQTEQQVIDNVRNLINSWQKTTVLCKDTPAFIVNRIARPFYGEAIRILEEGIADIPTIDWAMRTIGGFKMGPFELMDFIGHDINYKVTETVFEQFFYDPRYRPSFTQKRLVDAHFCGRKSNRGFYDYRENAENPKPTENHALGQEIFRRILVMLINEAADVLYLKIATRDDIESAMTLGVNYPKGLLAWADEIGIAQVVEKMDALHDEYLDSRYRCSPILRKMARESLTFC